MNLGNLRTLFTHHSGHAKNSYHAIDYQANSMCRSTSSSQLSGLACCRYNTSADIWSFGILLYELATGKAPYANMSLTKVILTTLHQDSPTLQNVKGRQFSEVRTCISSRERTASCGCLTAGLR